MSGLVLGMIFDFVFLCFDSVFWCAIACRPNIVYILFSALTFIVLSIIANAFFR